MVDVAEKKKVRSMERFEEVGRFKTNNGTGEVPIYIEPQSRVFLQDRESIKIDTYGWSFMKCLTIPDAVVPYYAQDSTCSVW